MFHETFIQPQRKTKITWALFYWFLVSCSMLHETSVPKSKRPSLQETHKSKSWRCKPSLFLFLHVTLRRSLSTPTLSPLKLQMTSYEATVLLCCQMRVPVFISLICRCCEKKFSETEAVQTVMWPSPRDTMVERMHGVMDLIFCSCKSANLFSNCGAIRHYLRIETSSNRHFFTE